LRRLLQELKFNGRLELAAALGLLLARHPELARRAKDYDLIAPVPLHPARLRERGFNQALELARPLSSRLGIPLSASVLRRARPTRRQQGLTRREREQNLRLAFSAASLDGRRILLLDDIMTTGATLRAAARCLLEAGASAVDVAVPARTPAINMCIAGAAR
jgi:ComF family protein